VITESDIQKANEQARILGSSLEEEIIYALPSSYTVDAKSNILNPLGLYSHKLEVDLFLISAKASFVQTVTHMVNQAGYEAKDVLFSGLATSAAVFSKDHRYGTTILCDIGSDITELLLFKDGRLKNIEALTLGGDDLTSELSETLKVPFDLAEDVKRSYANVGEFSPQKPDREILLKKNDAYKPIRQSLVSRIVTSKAEAICREIKSAVERLIPSDKIDNFIATGRTVQLDGFLESLENALGISVRLGRIVNPDISSWANKDDALSGIRYLNYVNSLGLLCQALARQRDHTLFTRQANRNPLLRAVNMFKEIYQEYF
jgi:cell division protein FtsA